jgi:hypothetical protein
MKDVAFCDFNHLFFCYTTMLAIGPSEGSATCIKFGYASDFTLAIYFTEFAGKAHAFDMMICQDKSPK